MRNDSKVRMKFVESRPLSFIRAVFSIHSIPAFFLSRCKQEIVEIDSNERKSIVRKVPKQNGRKTSSSAQRIEQGTLQPPTVWSKNSFYYKQDGIQSRNDNFAFGNAPLFQQASPFRPPIVTFAGASDPNSGERISSTLRTSIATTPKTPPTLYVWDGKTMPKNHKMA